MFQLYNKMILVKAYECSDKALLLVGKYTRK